MVISMISAAGSLEVERRQCSRFGDSEVFVGLHSGDAGSSPLYIPVSQNEGISGISLERHDLMLNANLVSRNVEADLRMTVWLESVPDTSEQHPARLQHCEVAVSLHTEDRNIGPHLGKQFQKSLPLP